MRTALNDLHESGSLSRERPHMRGGFLTFGHTDARGAHTWIRVSFVTEYPDYVLLSPHRDRLFEHNVTRLDIGYKYLHRPQYARRGRLEEFDSCPWLVRRLSYGIMEKTGAAQFLNYGWE